MSILRSFIALSALITLAGSAAASQVYDNGAPIAGGTSATSEPVSPMQQVSESFVLSSPDTKFNTVNWWGAYFGADTPTFPDDFTLRLFDDVSGHPAVNPTYEELIGDVGRTDTGLLDVFGDHIYAYSATVGPYTFSAGTQVWLSILNDTTSDTDDRWTWASPGTGGYYKRTSDGVAWTQQPTVDMAFNLELVPEPSALVLIGFGVLVLRRSVRDYFSRAMFKNNS
jgi:hypothetical protein